MRNGGFFTIALAIAVGLAFASPAIAQSGYTDVDLGDRAAGQTYKLALAAENRNCPQPLDFRFSSTSPELTFPAGPVVRQVPAGGKRSIEAILNLTDASPGRHELFVDVNCENCGFLIFKNCRINRQQLRLTMNVLAAAPLPQPNAAPAQAPAAPEIQIDYDDKRIPKPLRRKAEAANAAWLKKVALKKPCEDESAALRAKAAAAQEAADRAAMAAETAEQDARNEKAQREAAEKELIDANKESVAAQAALKAAEKDVKDANRRGTTQERADAADAAAKAKAAKEAADKRVEEAAKAVGLHTPKDIAQAEKDARNKRDAAARAGAAASAAADAAAAKERECLKLQEDADKAKAEKDNADKAARDAIPPPAAGAPPGDIAKQRGEVEKCATELGRLIEAQYLALQAMGRLGALSEGYESDLGLWAEAVDAANDLFGYVPPGIKYVSDLVGSAQTVLTAVRAAIGVASAVQYTGNLYNIPRNGNDVVDPQATKKWLKEEGLASDDAQAKLVYEQMKSYSKTGSTEQMQKDLDAARHICKGEEAKLDALEKTAKSN